MRQLKIGAGITDRSSKALDRYLVEIGRYQGISIEEEIELAQAIRKGGIAGARAQDRLVTANLRFVVSVAKQYQHQGLTLVDLVNEGNIGLIKAAKKFDETRGFKFISYAVWWIRQSILQAIAEQGRIVRLPLNQVGAVGTIKNTIENFKQKYQREPNVVEIAEITGLDEEKIRQTLNADGRPVSIDAPIQDDDTSTMADGMAGGSPTDHYADRASMILDIDAVLSQELKEREIQIIRQSFGIGCPEKGLEEIGAELGLTRERVRQIREKAITKLSKTHNAKVLKKYLG